MLSGSQRFKLVKEPSDSLSGRISIVELIGLSLREIQSDPFHDYFLPTMEYITERSLIAKAPDNTWEIIHRGDYPELQNPKVEWSAFYASYVKTYIERDVRDFSAVQDLDAFRRFMIAAAAAQVKC